MAQNLQSDFSPAVYLTYYIVESPSDLHFPWNQISCTKIRRVRSKYKLGILYKHL